MALVAPEGVSQDHFDQSVKVVQDEVAKVMATEGLLIVLAGDQSARSTYSTISRQLLPAVGLGHLTSPGQKL